MERIKIINDSGTNVELLHEVQTGAQRAQTETIRPVQLTYTQTRVIPVARDVLCARRVLCDEDSDPAHAAYKILRTQVLRRMRAQHWNTLGITSVGPGEGKTLTAINLAISIARDNHQSVLLVDADLRRPQLAGYFGVNSEVGLSDVLLDNEPVSGVMFHPGIERLVVLPGGRPVSGSSELLTTPNMARLVEEMKTRYPSRIVLFDLPPLTASDDVLAFSPLLDALLLVVEEGKTRRDDVVAAMKLLGSMTVLGTVLNKSEQTSGSYY